MANVLFSRWILESCLDGQYTRTVWASYEGAIANRERLLETRRESIGHGKFRVITPLGWTAIQREIRR